MKSIVLGVSPKLADLSTLANLRVGQLRKLAENEDYKDTVVLSTATTVARVGQ